MASLSDKKFCLDEKKLKISEQTIATKKIGKRKKENNLTIGIQNLDKLAPGPIFNWFDR